MTGSIYTFDRSFPPYAPCIFPHRIHCIVQSKVTTMCGMTFARNERNSVLGSFTVAIFAYFSAPFRFTFYITFSKMTPKMTRKWGQKGSFFQNGGTPPILQRGSFLFWFSFSFLNGQSKLCSLFPASTMLSHTPFAPLPSNSANHNDDNQRLQQQHHIDTTTTNNNACNTDDDNDHTTMATNDNTNHNYKTKVPQQQRAETMDGEGTTTTRGPRARVLCSEHSVHPYFFHSFLLNDEQQAERRPWWPLGSRTRHAARICKHRCTLIRLHRVLRTYRDTFRDSTDVPKTFRWLCDLR